MKNLNNERNKLKELTKISFLHDSIVRTKKILCQKVKNIFIRMEQISIYQELLKVYLVRYISEKE